MISIHSKAQWILQNPKLQAETLSNIVIADTSTAYCCGSKGTILKSTNKGISWQLLPTVTQDAINKLSFINAIEGWFITYSGKIFQTNNGGKSWSKISEIDTNSTVFDFRFINKNVGFITGHFNPFLRTTDGGKTWQIVNLTDKPFSTSATSITFCDDKNGYLLLGYYTIYKTSDGGLTWLPLTINISFPGSYYVRLFCLTSNTFYVYGDTGNPFIESGFIYKTTDGGITWAYNKFEEPIGSLYFKNANEGVATSLHTGNVYVTKDGGQKWGKSNSIIVNAAYFQDNTAIGIRNSNVIFRSSDNWNTNTIATPTLTQWCLNSVAPLDSLNSVVCGVNEFIGSTSDGGNTWSTINDKSGSGLYDILFPSKENIISCGNGIIIRSSNGGKSWQRDSLEATWFSDLEYVNDNNIYVVGSDKGKGVVFQTTNKGVSWNKINIPQIESHVDKIKYGNSKIGWITSNNQLFRTTDSGTSWEKINNVNILFGAIEAKDNSAWITSLNYVWVTTDKGETWTQNKMFDYGNSIFSTYCISMKNNNEGITGLFDGRIFDTNDGGRTWMPADKITNMPIYDIKYTGNKYAWAVGDMGLIMKYSPTEVSVKYLNYPIPTAYSLTQNYPNPFNPSTTIEYTIPKAEHVTLKVFDVLGREVATLVNEYKQAGRYNSQFSIRNFQLSSGVYFYRLQAGSYSTSKKMIIIK